MIWYLPIFSIWDLLVIGIDSVLLIGFNQIREGFIDHIRVFNGDFYIQFKFQFLERSLRICKVFAGKEDTFCESYP